MEQEKRPHDVETSIAEAKQAIEQAIRANFGYQCGGTIGVVVPISNDGRRLGRPKPIVTDRVR